MFKEELKIKYNNSVDEKLIRYEILAAEANTVRNKDKSLIKKLLKNFYNRRLDVGIGFQIAYGSILSGDYFDLIKLPDGNYLFIFADISGHGLPAYTTLIRLRSAITLAIKEIKKIFNQIDSINTDYLIKDISTRFTDIMDETNSTDFACVNFAFITNREDRFIFRFYNRSMLYPIVIRKHANNTMDVYNLNNKFAGWCPQTGHLLGSDVRKLLGDSYLYTPECEFTLYEGDSILFFSDGIVEATHRNDKFLEFGQQRIEEHMLENIQLPPQLSINLLFESVYEFMGSHEKQRDDMTAVLVNLPRVTD